MKKPSCCFVLFLVILMGLQFDPCDFQENNDCVTRTKCSECIQIPGCAWCSHKNYLQNLGSRCNLVAKLYESGCPASNISNPSSRPEELEKRDLGGELNTQVSPQRVKLHLRPGEPANLRVTVRPAENYPVDLYYLMDMSLSMEDDLVKLKDLGGKIAESIQNITRNFKLGFGSFVDKPVSPFFRPEQKKPCAVFKHCVPTYGYRHILPLSSDSKRFQDLVQQQNISGNLDDPEGGLDALMQVAVCEQDIGWSKYDTSRRLVILVTDAQFHLAGDGKLGGIVRRNDARCHLINNEYSKSTELDYPTLAQLHEKLRENQIQPIFAVTEKVTPLYNSISEMWSDLGAVTGKLANDSRNIVDLIQESYNKIATTVRLAHNATDGVTVDYRAQCDKNQNTETKKCTDVPIAKSVFFDLSITLQQCPKDMNTKLEPFQIRFPGFGKVTVELQPICHCQCEDEKEENSTQCSGGNGAFACGVCECHKGRYGKFCECDSPFDQQKDMAQCIRNGTDEPACSGMGQCACGQCECFKDPRGLIYGDKCQCDDFNCPQDHGIPCGGEKQGKCSCGKCHCTGVYTGVNCGQRNCSLLTDECRKTSQSEICSGADRGECVCGECKCKSKYTGKFCEECPMCKGGICSRNKDCVICTTGPDKQSLDQCKTSSRCETLVNSVQTVSDISTKTSRERLRCDHKDENDCLYLYTYEKMDGKDLKTYTLFVEKNCPEQPNILAIVLGLIGGIVTIGLILILIWKLLVSMADRVEYQRFEKELQSGHMKQHISPIYRNPVTTTVNVIYAGSR